MIAAFDMSGLAILVTAITGAISAAGVILIKILDLKMNKVKEKVEQVEKQGNSTSLELKRTNMVYARATAVATKKAVDIARADDAEKVYEEAKKANAKL